MSLAATEFDIPWVDFCGVFESGAVMQDVSNERPTWRQALTFWFWLGCVSFGGPAAQIALMQRELVEKRGWIDRERFQHALNFCMLLPGPEAMQLATYIGWSLHGTRGGLAAGALFVLPSAALLWALSWIYMAGGTLPWIAAAFHGLQPAVIALIVAAIWRMFFRNVTSHALRILALTSFLAVFFLKTPFFIVIAAAAGVGMILGWMNRTDVGLNGQNEPASDGKLGFAPIILCVTWWLPVLFAAWLGTWHGIFAQMGVFFSKVSLLTFGGAYAILPYVSQTVVADWKWLTESQMIAGLGLAETTPGPLIMVLQFVGFAAAWQNPGTLSPLMSGTLGAAMTTWTTFLPAFVLVLTGAPFMERIRRMAVLRNALSGISAAVVGVMLNLAVWLGWHVFRPETGSWDWTSLVLSVGFLVLFERGKFSVPLGVLLAGVIGILRWAAWGA